MTKDEAVLIQELRKKSPDLRKVGKAIPSLESAAIDYTCHVIQSEIKQYVSRPDNLMKEVKVEDKTEKDSSPSVLESFSFQVA